jgi:dCMP deaminase
LDKWDRRFLGLAQEVSTWSKDPSTKVGAVIVRPDNTIASLGYNGFPRGMRDDPELYKNREAKLSRVIHAEVNAILNARENLSGYTLYIHPLSPCDRCAVQIIQSGIIRVVSIRISDAKRSENWDKIHKKANEYFKEAGIKLEIWPRINGELESVGSLFDWKSKKSYDPGDREPPESGRVGSLR